MASKPFSATLVPELDSVSRSVSLSVETDCYVWLLAPSHWEGRRMHVQQCSISSFSLLLLLHSKSYPRRILLPSTPSFPPLLPGPFPPFPAFLPTFLLQLSSSFPSTSLSSLSFMMSEKKNKPFLCFVSKPKPIKCFFHLRRRESNNSGISREYNTLICSPLGALWGQLLPHAGPALRW